MKVLIINGSPRNDGNCAILIEELKKEFSKYEVETVIQNIGTKEVRGCMACLTCKKTKNGCVLNDIVNEASEKFKEADGLIVVSPVYFGSPNGSVISLLDRLFYSRNYDVRFKVGANFNIARRGGTEASFDIINKYFTISGMPIASGDYWNNAFGGAKGEAKEDLEGLRNARIVAKRMAFLMKSIKDGKEKYQEMLEDEPRVATNFIR